MAWYKVKGDKEFGWYWVEMKCKKVKIFKFSTAAARSAFISKLEDLGCEVYRTWFN